MQTNFFLNPQAPAFIRISIQMTYFPAETPIPPTAENCCIQWRVIPTQIPLPAWCEKCCRIFRHKNTFALPFSFTHLCLTNYAYRRGQINYHKNNIQIRIFQCTGIIIIFSIPLFIMSCKYIFCFVGNVWNSTHYIKSHKKLSR